MHEQLCLHSVPLLPINPFPGTIDTTMTEEDWSHTGACWNILHAALLMHMCAGGIDCYDYLECLLLIRYLQSGGIRKSTCMHCLQMRVVYSLLILLDCPLVNTTLYHSKVDCQYKKRETGLCR